jgi:hypothetical protein
MLAAMESMTLSRMVETDLGPLSLYEEEGALVRLRFGREGGTDASPLLLEAEPRPSALQEKGC